MSPLKRSATYLYNIVMSKNNCALIKLRATSILRREQKHVSLFRKSTLRGCCKSHASIWIFEFFEINISLLVRCSPDYYIKMFPFGSSFGSYFVPPFEGVTIRDISLNKTCFCLQLYGNKPMFRGNVLSARSFFFIKIKTVHRGAFCQFPFW